jgi:hypothetical protein
LTFTDFTNYAALKLVCYGCKNVEICALRL